MKLTKKQLEELAQQLSLPLRHLQRALNLKGYTPAIDVYRDGQRVEPKPPTIRTTFAADRRVCEEDARRHGNEVGLPSKEITAAIARMFPTISKDADGKITLRLVSSDKMGNSLFNHLVREHFPRRRKDNELTFGYETIGRWK